MCKYIKEYEENQNQNFKYNKRGVKPGTGSKMQSTQETKLTSDILSNTPDSVGLNYTLWNSKAVHEYISSKYSINYNRRFVRKIMRRLGFTAQKPIKLAYQRNPEKIKVWLTDTYPKIKAKAMKEGARIYWGDEMGLQSTDNIGRTYGLKGKTPIIHRTDSRFKCNMLAAISPQGRSDE